MSIHTKNFQILNSEMFKVKIGKSPSIMHELFQIDDSNNFNLRKNRGLKHSNPITVYYGTETISVSGTKLWIILSDQYKNSASLEELKTKVKNWVPLNCPCRLCKTIHSKCWLYLISIANSIFTLFVQLVCNEYFVMFCCIL